MDNKFSPGIQYGGMAAILDFCSFQKYAQATELREIERFCQRAVIYTQYESKTPTGIHHKSKIATWQSSWIFRNFRYMLKLLKLEKY